MSERVAAGPGRTNHLWIVNPDATEVGQVLRNAGGDFGFAPSWAPR